MRVPVFTVVLSLAPALVLPQSLGDAARQQSRKRSERPAAKVYTDADLHPASDRIPAPPPPSATAPGQEVPAVTPAASGVRPETEGSVRDRLDREAAARKEQEATWRRLAATARARLDAAQREHDVACGPGVLVLSGG